MYYPGHGTRRLRGAGVIQGLHSRAGQVRWNAFGSTQHLGRSGAIVRLPFLEYHFDGDARCGGGRGFWSQRFLDGAVLTKVVFRDGGSSLVRSLANRELDSWAHPPVFRNVDGMTEEARVKLSKLKFSFVTS